MEALSVKQKAYRLVLAARRGESARSYCQRMDWPYVTTRDQLVRAGEWHRVMAARYERPVVR